MKPIENIFGFDCATCEHNRHCYGGNMGNQFRYCQKSAEKIQNLDNLEQQCKKQKEVIDKVAEKIKDYKIYCEKNKGFTEYTDIEIEAIEPVISKLEDILKEVSE